MSKYEIGEVMSDEDSLRHYGVKGMKWGQRRAQPDSSGVSRRDARVALAKASHERYETLFKAEQKTSGEAIVGAIFAAAQLAAR